MKASYPIKNGSCHHSSRKWACCSCQEVRTPCSSPGLGSRTAPGEGFRLTSIKPCLSYVGIFLGFSYSIGLSQTKTIFTLLPQLQSNKIEPLWPRTPARLRRRSVDPHWSRSASTCGDITDMEAQIWSEEAGNQLFINSSLCTVEQVRVVAWLPTLAYI